MVKMIQENNMNKNPHTKRKKGGLAILIGLLIGMALIVQSTTIQWATAAPSVDTTITLSPNASSIVGCDMVDVEIWINDVTDLYGADVRLTFDPAILQVVDVNGGVPGVQIANGTFLQVGWSPFKVHADNTAGTIKYAITQFNPTLPVSGSGVLATITFQAKAVGNSDVAFTYTKLADRNGTELPATSLDGAVGTSAVAAGPDVSIARLNANDLRLSWPALPSGASIDIYRDTEPYFTPGTPYQTVTDTTTYDDLGTLGDLNTNYYYILQTVCNGGLTSPVSNRVGEYDYPIVSGFGSNYNDVAISLKDPNITDAASVATYVGDFVTRVAKYNSDTQSFKIYVKGLPFTNYPVVLGDFLFVLTTDGSPASTAIVGDVPAEGEVTFNLVSGTPPIYNYLSVPLDQEEIISASVLAAKIGSGVVRVAKYNNVTQSYIIYIPGLSFTDFPLVIGEPVVVHMSGTSTWP